MTDVTQKGLTVQVGNGQLAVLVIIALIVVLFSTGSIQNMLPLSSAEQAELGLARAYANAAEADMSMTDNRLIHADAQDRADRYNEQVRRIENRE